MYVIKASYAYVFMEDPKVITKWWWKKKMEFKGGYEGEVFFGLALSKNVLSWDILEKRERKGPSIYMMCKEHKDIIFLLLVECHFRKEVWSISKTLSGRVSRWEVNSLRNVFRT